jgi:hypothetical protein
LGVGSSRRCGIFHEPDVDLAADFVGTVVRTQTFAPLPVMVFAALAAVAVGLLDGQRVDNEE